MKTVTVALQKGGVGKTTTTINLGAALANAGKRVLMVDVDPQASLSKGVGIKVNDQTRGAYNLFKDLPVTIARQNEYLAIIPTSSNLAGLTTELNNHINPNGILRDALVTYSNDYDVILVDTPPNLDRFTLNALVAADYLIIPCTCQRMALEGLQDLFKTISRAKTMNPQLSILAVIPTLYTANRKIEQEALANLQEQFGALCQPPLLNRVEYLRASNEQRPVSGDLFDYWQNLANYVIEKAGI
jgi:chromosome partitioning protein